MAGLTRCELNVATVSHRELPTRKNFTVHLILVIYLVLSFIEGRQQEY